MLTIDAYTKELCKIQAELYQLSVTTKMKELEATRLVAIIKAFGEQKLQVISNEDVKARLAPNLEGKTDEDSKGKAN